MSDEWSLRENLETWDIGEILNNAEIEVPGFTRKLECLVATYHAAVDAERQAMTPLTQCVLIEALAHADSKHHKFAGWVNDLKFVQKLYVGVLCVRLSRMSVLEMRVVLDAYKPMRKSTPPLPPQQADGKVSAMSPIDVDVPVFVKPPTTAKSDAAPKTIGFSQARALKRLETYVPPPPRAALLATTQKTSITNTALPGALLITSPPLVAPAPQSTAVVANSKKRWLDEEGVDNDHDAGVNFIPDASEEHGASHASTSTTTTTTTAPAEPQKKRQKKKRVSANQRVVGATDVADEVLKAQLNNIRKAAQPLHKVAPSWVDCTCYPGHYKCAHCDVISSTDEEFRAHSTAEHPECTIRCTYTTCTFMTTVDSKRLSHEHIMHGVIGRAACCPKECRDTNNNALAANFVNESGFHGHMRLAHEWKHKDSKREYTRQQAEIAGPNGAAWFDAYLKRHSDAGNA